MATPFDHDSNSPAFDNGQVLIQTLNTEGVHEDNWISILAAGCIVLVE
jgi:hypothetical protein